MLNQSNQNDQNNALALASNASAGQNSMLQVAGRVTNDDIVAIFISKHQENMNMRRLRADRDLRSTNGVIKQIETELAAIGPEVAKTVKFKEATKIAEQLNAGGFGKFEARVSLEGTKLDDKTWTIEISVGKVEKSQYASTPTFTSVASKEIVLPFTKAAIDLARDLKDHQEELLAAQAELLEIKRELSNIPQLQLRARAKLAELALSKTEEGQEILTQLMGTTSLPTEL